ncbi:MAG: 4Fe-4S binding protein [Candidatus Thermoplasmatota archaeon]|nr:4Fe-4S binding protein [Candidatus Thermoplasmatota archaeon]
MKLGFGATITNAGSSKEYKTGEWRVMKPIWQREKCTKCYLCYEYCPDSCISKTEDGIIIDYEHCKGCGICAYECPKDAIALVPEER